MHANGRHALISSFIIIIFIYFGPAAAGPVPMPMNVVTLMEVTHMKENRTLDQNTSVWLNADKPNSCPLHNTHVVML